ncbi:unnamed protein product [Lactuca virosa]|uniref:Uncharacterized protein n=1 Tax=Lactuca virosa TaxID=75947 RepID=A0AAU9ME77_9ASTR|nr:unnamed protein product [Lactuca virosa]
MKSFNTPTVLKRNLEEVFDLELNEKLSATKTPKISPEGRINQIVKVKLEKSGGVFILSRSFIRINNYIATNQETISSPNQQLNRNNRIGCLGVIRLFSRRFVLYLCSPIPQYDEEVDPYEGLFVYKHTKILRIKEQPEDPHQGVDYVTMNFREGEIKEGSLKLLNKLAL